MTPVTSARSAELGTPGTACAASVEPSTTQMNDAVTADTHYVKNARQVRVYWATTKILKTAWYPISSKIIGPHSNRTLL